MTVDVGDQFVDVSDSHCFSILTHSSSTHPPTSSLTTSKWNVMLPRKHDNS